MKIIIFISIVCLSSLEASSFSLSTQKSTETTSVSGSEKCSAGQFSRLNLIYLKKINF